MNISRTADSLPLVFNGLVTARQLPAMLGCVNKLCDMSLKHTLELAERDHTGPFRAYAQLNCVLFEGDGSAVAETGAFKQPRV